MAKLLWKTLQRMLPYRMFFGNVLAEQAFRLAAARQDKLERLLRLASARIIALESARGAASAVPVQPSSALNAHELCVYSQNGEDGILQHIFSLAGTTDRRFVEFGVEDGTECNSANLCLNHGWSGLLIDGDPKNVEAGKRFYMAQGIAVGSTLQFLCAFVDAGNINDLIRSSGFSGEIDFLSVDIDGNDYWVWRSIDCINPRVVAVEYNASFGPSESVTIAYDPQFVWASTRDPEYAYHGASLAALDHLAREKGYRLVGCDEQGINAFFVRNDVAAAQLPRVSVADAYRPHVYRTVLYGTDGQAAAVNAVRSKLVRI